MRFAFLLAVAAIGAAPSLVGCGQTDEPVVVSRGSLSSHGTARKSEADEQARQKSATDDSALSEKARAEKERAEEEARKNDPENVVKAVADPAAFRPQLDNYMKSFRDEKNWTYGERTPGELAGIWTPDDGSDKQMIFEVDGMPGTYAERFQGRVVNGIYAISESGKVVAVARGGGISIGSHTRLQDNVLMGPHGPRPLVHWRRKPMPQ